MRIKNMILSLKMPKKFDTPLHFSVLVLIAFGTLMIISTNAGSTGGPLILVKVFVKQLAFVLISYFLMTFFANNFTMRRAQKLLPIVGVFLIMALLATQFFKDINGSNAWIRIPIPGMEITIQPSEFAKVFMVIIMALYVEVAGKKNLDFWNIVKVPMIFFFFIFIAVVLQKDIGSTLVLCLMVVICFFIPSHVNLRKIQRIFRYILIVLTAAGVFIMSSPGSNILKYLPSHITTRVENANNPFLHPLGGGYQQVNGLYGFARGGITGVGLGESIQKYGYLTQSDNDFILSIIVEELGVFGLGIVVLGYLLILQRLFYYAFRTKSEGYKIILIGNGLYIFIHFALNVGGVSGLIPLTGVPLLFVSSGGSSLMSIMTSIGISQAVISRIRRQGTITSKRNKKEPQGEGAL